MLEVTVGRITHSDAHALIVYLMEGGPGSHPANATHAVDRLLGGALRQAVAAGTLTGRRGEVWTAQKGRTLVIVVGIGAAEAFSEEVAAEAVRLGCERATALEARDLATVTLGTGRGGLSVEASAAAVARGVHRAGGTVPVSLLVYDPDNLEAALTGVATLSESL